MITTCLRVLLLFLPGLLFGQWNSKKVYRGDHAYLWQDHQHLRQIHWLDAIESIAEYVPVRDTSYFKSLVYLAAGKLTRANQAIEEHFRIAPNHFPYETRIILGLANIRYYYKAYRHFEEAIELDPGRVEGYLEKLKVFADQENYLVGIDHANQAIRLFPDELRLYVLRGSLYITEGLRNRAFKDFKKVVDAEQTLNDFYMAQSHRGLAWAYLGLNDVARAEVQLLESMVIEPNHPMSRGLLAEINFLKDDAKGAIEAYETIVGTENRKNYYLMIGLAHEKLSQMEEACKFFKACCDREIPLGCKKLKELKCEE